MYTSANNTENANFYDNISLRLNNSKFRYQIDASKFHQNYIEPCQSTVGEHLTHTFLPKHSRFIDAPLSHVMSPRNLSESALFAKNPQNNPPCLSYGHGTSDNQRRGIVSDFRITVSRHLGISRSCIAHDLTRRRQDRP